MKKIRKLVPYIKYRFELLSRNKRGQITLNSEIGKWLQLISSLNSTHTIMEIGTWNGAGSSKVICESIVHYRTTGNDVNVIGLEIDRKQYEIAKKNLKKYNFFNVVLGSVVEKTSLDNELLDKTEKIEFEIDSKNLESVPNILNIIPLKLDLLVLDGGGFSTYQEFQLLGPRAKYIILDDTKIRKSKKILDEAKTGKKFTVIFESDERNGTAVLLNNDLILNQS